MGQKENQKIPTYIVEQYKDIPMKHLKILIQISKNNKQVQNLIEKIMSRSL